MPPYVRILTALAALTIAPVTAASQPLLASATPVSQQVSLVSGRIHGIVRDVAGHGIADAMVLALGTSVETARSDPGGRFTLVLAPGDYVLRANRAGYVSTYKEPIRIQSNVLLERNITLLRSDVVQPTDGPLDDQPADHAHNEAAWRLRHLTQTPLRDVAPGIDFGLGDRATPSFKSPSFIDRLLEGSAHAATSFFGGTDFSGQVNLLTTSSFGVSDGWRPNEWPRGIAAAAVSAPVGAHGDWTVRGAMAAGSAASWVLLGEYDARSDEPHALKLGVSYSAQVYSTLGASARTADAVRNVGGLYAFDRWRITSGLQLDIGGRFDRYDYLARPSSFSPRLGVRAAILPDTYVTALASERTIAPGADEFLPPASGPWLPPERTFASLIPGSPLKAERVRHVETGLEHEFGFIFGKPTIGVRRFEQSTVDQVSTAFGLDEARGVGHYYVATPGSFDLDGWAVRASGTFTSHVRGAIDYAVSDTHWSHTCAGTGLARLVPSIARARDERVQNLTASVDASLNGDATRLTLAYRLDSARSLTEASKSLPLRSGRFDLRLHQSLPFQPIHGTKLEALLAIRNLLRDLRDAASVYDELLTSSPPLRIMGGVQVKF